MATQTLLVVLALIGAMGTGNICQAFHMEVNPEEFEIYYTENVQVSCNNNGDQLKDMANVTRIRIAKEDEGGTWKNLAKIIEQNVKILDDPDAIGTGQIGRPENAFLKVSWPLASEKIVGKYRCDVVGVNNKGEFVFANTDPIMVADTDKSITDVLEVLDRQRNQAQMKFDSIKMQLLEVSQRKAKIETEKIERHFADTDIRFEKIESKLDELLALIQLDRSLPCDPNPILTEFDEEIWPFGYFGLLQPKTGCPAGIDHEWLTGTRQHLTNGESQVPSTSQLSTPIISGNFFYQRFCMINNTESQRAWPKGSYCINRKRGYCPGGFIPGFMRYDDKRSGSARSGVLPDGYYSTYTRIYYCCRNDGPATTALVLPTAKPFYLYRYKGLCQQVRGMKVKPEYFLIDTAGDDNGDSYNSKTHPDGELNPIKVNLCFYEKI